MKLEIKDTTDPDSRHICIGGIKIYVMFGGRVFNRQLANL
jgi:hypothetical protein